MAHTTTLANGQQVQYVDTVGPCEAAPTVVLLHAFLTDSRMFDPQVEALGRDFRLIAVDERGHGGTPGDGPFDYWDVARDVLGLLDELQVERAAVVGTSQGGFVGMRLALLAPERVSALAVLGTSADAQAPEIAAGYLQMGEVWAAKGGTPELVDTMVAICLGESAPDAVRERWREIWAQVPGDRVLANIHPLVGRDSLVERLAEITCPTLVLHGSADAAYPVAHAQQIAEGVPGAEPLVLIEGGGHFLSLTDADEVNPALRAFLLRHA